MRQQGSSYSEILREIKVAKSTLSLWLRSVSLSKTQKQRLTEKKLLGIKKGGQVRRNQRLASTEAIQQTAIGEIGHISERELWLIGIALYWAEGNKQKEHNISQGASFSNSDPHMIKLFLRWLRAILHITDQEFKCELYIHENSKDRLDEVIQFWVNITKRSRSSFNSIYFKKNKGNNYRKNQGTSYYGLIRIVLSKSTDLNRKISGWIKGIYNNCEIV